MPLKGPAFYDEASVFEKYQALRRAPGNANDALEKPAFLELLGPVKGKRVVDLGCGDGRFGVELLRKGAADYFGIEGSRNMVAEAMRNLEDYPASLLRCGIEDWRPEPRSCELVVSRLALHYVRDLESVFRKAKTALTAGGRLVFSVEHPILTSSAEGLGKAPTGSSWRVKRYFEAGPRKSRWLGRTLLKHHRSIEDHVLALSRAGLTLQGLREGSPSRGRRLQFPLFLLLSAIS